VAVRSAAGGFYLAGPAPPGGFFSLPDMKQFLTALLLLPALAGYGQVSPASWNQLRSIKAPGYELQVPDQWRVLPVRGPGPEQFFEASGLALPASFDGAPVVTTVFVVRQQGQDLADCKQKCLSGYRDNPDREFPAGYQPGETKIKLASGQDAWLLSTHFYRPSKGLNQSRYDLVTYSPTARTGYLYTVSVQYRSSDYQFEQANDLAGFASRLYSYFRLLD
jgi:hypothetical protein